MIDIAEINAALEVAGYQIVPLEPTDEMVKAGDELHGGIAPHAEVYKAMIAAHRK